MYYIIKYDDALITDFSGGGGEFFEAEPRQECVVEREASWGIAKSSVDWGRAFDVGEVAGGRGRQWGRVAERARARSQWDELYF